jgi:hypothetical protein
MQKPFFSEQIHIEWEAWQKVVESLRLTNSVTEHDLKSSPLLEAKTPGMTLIQHIIKWGDELAKLRVEQANSKG